MASMLEERALKRPVLFLLSGPIQLPNEIIEIIGHYLEPSDFFPFTAVSRDMRELAIPLAYRDVTIDASPDPRTGWPRIPSPVELFLRMLLLKPWIVNYVKRLAIRFRPPCALTGVILGRPMDHGPNRFHRTCWTDDEHEALSYELAKQFPGPVTTPLDEPYATSGVPIFLLLAKLNKIQRLELDTIVLRLVDSLDFFDHDALGSFAPYLWRNPFRELESLRMHEDLEACDTVYTLRYSYIRYPTLLGCAPIRDLSLAIGAREMAWDGDLGWKLQSLKLHHTFLCETSLGRFLKKTPSLRSLEYHMYFDFSVIRRLNLFRVSQSLQHVKDTLEHLSLSMRFVCKDPRFRWETMTDWWDVAGQVRGLYGFTKLTSLEIPYTFLLGCSPKEHPPTYLYSAIPSSLQSLTLTDHLAEFRHGCSWRDHQLLSYFATFLPPYSRHSDGEHRVKFGLRLVRDTGDWQAKQRESLSLLCSRLGVSCTILKRYPDLTRYLYPLDDLDSRPDNTKHDPEEGPSDCQ